MRTETMNPSDWRDAITRGFRLPPPYQRSEKSYVQGVQCRAATYSDHYVFLDFMSFVHNDQAGKSDKEWVFAVD